MIPMCGSERIERVIFTFQTNTLYLFTQDGLLLGCVGVLEALPFIFVALGKPIKPLPPIKDLDADYTPLNILSFST